jgi:hypothetical protein
VYLESVSGKSKWLVVAALFAVCVAPTFISYQPYLFTWDDGEYLIRSTRVSLAFWSGNAQGLVAAMVSGRPPAMTLLGLPWGRPVSWDVAGNCFVTLAAVISLLAALCLYLLLRIGVKPFLLVAASVCVFASIGPFPRGGTVHADASAFMADSLFAWTTLAAVVLIPYEARTRCSSIRGAILRGILWGSILSLGVMTKFSFLYFVVLIVPVLFFIKVHHDGPRFALTSLIAFACCSAPSALYLLRWGGSAFDTAKAASFGAGPEYYVPPLQFLGNSIRESPGLVLSFVLTAAALVYLVIKKRLIQSLPDFLALLTVIGFCMIVLSVNNRQIRYLFPVIVALPFLTGILMSGKGQSVSRRSAALAAGLVFCGLLAAGVPTRHRAKIECLHRAGVVLGLAHRCNVKSVLLATDSPTLNVYLLDLPQRSPKTGQ